MTRRFALACLSGAVIQARERSGNSLLASREEFRKAKEKARRQDWARDILAGILQRAELAVTQPLNVPDKSGQWGHWYACPKDGVALVTDSPTRHRCPLCGTVYTGEPYDSVYIGGVHGANSIRMRDLGLAFAFTNKAGYARRLSEMLVAYADRYRSYPRHDNNGKDTVTAGRITSQTLDESTWAIPVVWAYTIARDTMASAARLHVETDLLRPLAETIVGPSFDKLPNIQCWKNSAIGCIGFALEDQGLVSTALENPVRGFNTLMANKVTPGGLWIEGSLGYQDYALQAIWPLAEAAKRHGVDLYANENYRSLFDGPIGLALPNGDPPGFNDNPGENLAQWSEVYELAYARWKRPEYGRVLRLKKRDSVAALMWGEEVLPEGDAIPKTSVVFRDAGFAAMRSPDVTIAVRSGLHGGGHGHPDKLDIVTYGMGVLFGVDPGSIGYGAPLHREWYRSTIAHNTVSVDQELQSTADARITNWSAAENETKLTGEAQVYAGVTFRRELALQGDKLTDRFACEANAEHIYDWAFHAEGTLNVSVAMSDDKAKLGDKNGYQHIGPLKRGVGDQEWTAQWKKGKAVLTLRVKGAPGTEIFTGSGPGRDPAKMVDLLIIRRRAERTVFEVEHTFSAN